MAHSNLLSSSTNNDVGTAALSSTMQTSNKEQLKSKFKLAVLDDIEKKKPHQLKETADEIKRLLNMKIDRYTITAYGITKSHLASWWSKFGFAKETISGEVYFISNFVSCQKCFTTYRYSSTSSTESISRHECNGSLSFKSNTMENKRTLDNHVIQNKKPFRPFEQQYVTKLFSIWISENLRPISIIEDEGLREICAYLYDLGTKNLGRQMDLQSLFQSGQTISRSITHQAPQYREQLIDLIKEPIKSQSLTVSPDMWCDRYRQISYLGITVTFVDLSLHFRKFTMCCRIFPVELAKTGENISKVLTLNFT